MNKKRLLKLADLLEADAKKKKGVKFNLSLWGKVDVIDPDQVPKTVKVDCGTTACAIGLACISGAFKRAGLRAVTVSKNATGGNNIKPAFGQYREWSAVQEFFGLNFDALRFLFTNAWYDHENMDGARGEKIVAKRIRDFVAGKATP